MLERLCFAARNLAGLMRILAVAGSGGVYLMFKDIGDPVFNCGFFAAMFGILCIICSVVLDLVAGDKK